MKLWLLPDAGKPDRVVNLESFIGLEVRENRETNVRTWRLLGILNGSFALLFESSDEDKVRAKFADGVDVLTGHKAPLGVSWRGPGD